MSHDSSPHDSSREKLLAAARLLFSTRGFDATTVKELSDEAGVNVSLVSYHFGGKDGLYRACLEQFGRERLDVARKMLQPPKSAEEIFIRLRMFAEEMFRCHVDESELTQIIHRECELGLPLAEDIFKETFMEVFGSMVEFWRVARERKLIRPELDPQTLAGIFFGVVMHTAKSERINVKFYKQSISDEAYRNRVLDHIERTVIRGALMENSSGERAK